MIDKDTDRTQTYDRAETDPALKNSRPYEKGKLSKIAGQVFSIMSVASIAIPLVCLLPQVAIPITIGYLFAGAAGGIGFGLTGSWFNHKYRQAVEGESYGRSSGSYRNSYSGYDSDPYYGGSSGSFWNGYMIGSIFNGGGSSGGGYSGGNSRDQGKALAVLLLAIAAAAAFYCSGKSVYDNFIKAGPVAPEEKEIKVKSGRDEIEQAKPDWDEPLNGPAF